MKLWTFFADHHQEIISATLQHLSLVAMAMLLAILIGVPLGMLAVKHKRLGVVALGIASIFQTIPSLAFF
jgi:osmoprotectant transport system permease protein